MLTYNTASRGILKQKKFLTYAKNLSWNKQGKMLHYPGFFQESLQVFLHGDTTVSRVKPSVIVFLLPTSNMNMFEYWSFVSSAISQTLHMPVIRNAHSQKKKNVFKIKSVSITAEKKIPIVQHKKWCLSHSGMQECRAVCS